MGSVKAGTRPPWVGLGAAVWVQIAAGNAYNFPLYSHSLKSVLGFSQSQLTMIGVANDIGENMGILPGLVCNRFPPWLMLLIGGLSCFLGYGVMWLSVSRTVQPLPYWLLWFALCIATNSSAWFSTAVLVTNMRNFPLSRGTVAGILKGYGGLSAAVFTEVYSTVLHHSSANLLLFLAIGVPILCLLMMYFIKPCVPYTEESSASHGNFVFTQAASVVLGFYLLITTALGDVFSVGVGNVTSIIYLAIMVFLLMAPLAIPIKMTFYPVNVSAAIHQKGITTSDSSDQLRQEFAADDDSTEPLLTPSVSTTSLGSFREPYDMSDVNMLLAVGEGAAMKKKRKPRRGEDFTFTEALCKADFWLLFFVYFVGVGSGVTVLNNLAQIGIAQGVRDTTILLSIFSFCNFVGRLGGGVLSEHFVRTRKVPRTLGMTVTQITMIFIYLLFAFALDGTLYIAAALLGICYGVQFSIMIPTVSELFGLQNFGLFFNFISLGNPIGAFLFSGLLAGYLYDEEVNKQQHGLNLLASSSSACIGPNCFMLTFLILAGLCVLGTISSIILSVRIKPVYDMLYADGSFRLPQPNDH
ncbi:unnamed protein product [Rhodiola kirilowii]